MSPSLLRFGFFSKLESIHTFRVQILNPIQQRHLAVHAAGNPTVSILFILFVSHSIVAVDRARLLGFVAVFFHTTVGGFGLI